jgi:hypothetical protein
MENYFGNNQIKKRAAELHNKRRIEAHVERVRIAQDKIDNPEKYKAKRRVRSSALMAYMVTAAALNI